MPSNDLPQHDRRDLFAFLDLTLPLEAALESLQKYRKAHYGTLRACEQVGLDATIRSLAMTLADLHNRP